MFEDRRRFLRQISGAGVALGIGSALPRVLWEAAASQRVDDGERFVVVIQLSGGNDGLNTIAPYADDRYVAARKTLHLRADQVLRIDDRLGWHPGCAGVAELLQAGKLSVVQGVGYANPNRSHFESMDIWHSCRGKEGRRSEGWLGRALDEQLAGTVLTDPAAFFLGGTKLPAALVSRSVPVPTLDSPERFRLRESDAEALGEVLTPVKDMSEQADELTAFLEQSTDAALSASRRVAEALSRGEGASRYPNTPLAGKLRTVGQLIDAGLKTRIFYVELDGFDTHAQQGEAHASLLQQWSDALSAFANDLQGMGRFEDALVLTFSEFGRRVEENASEGTDHGAAAPVFLAGGGVQGGVIGELPSLEDLDDGDLRYHTDFRQVYATILEGWLGWESSRIVGEGFPPLDLLRGSSRS